MAKPHGDPSDTIAAIATPSGIGGIAVIRISGPGAIALVDKGMRIGRRLADADSHSAHVGRFVDDAGVSIDEVVATVFRTPRSYTGEDVVEVSCHGGNFIAHRILDSLVRCGARVAAPGEFTKRAFLNGKLDLAQAEAVADLISSHSEMARRVSLDQLSGGISKRIGALRDSLVSALALLELELDFVEEGIEFADKRQIEQRITEAATEIGRMIATYSAGRMLREGVRVVLAGSPNVGKSSLLNALLDEDRAIVTEVPGTTRDVIEEGITIGGLQFILSDTAGVRATVDIVEQQGVERTEKKIQHSDILLLVVDASRQISGHELSMLNRVLREVKNSSTQCIIILNKSDLGIRGESVEKIEQISAEFPKLRISAKTRSGISELEQAMVSQAKGGKMDVSESGVLITNLRHKGALSRAKESLELARKALASGQSGEFVAVDLREGLESLGEIIGVTSTDDILNAIFSKFCIGK
jgi:tRNA modification GTPase